MHDGVVEGPYQGMPSAGHRRLGAGGYPRMSRLEEHLSLISGVSEKLRNYAQPCVTNSDSQDVDSDCLDVLKDINLPGAGAPQVDGLVRPSHANSGSTLNELGELLIPSLAAALYHTRSGVSALRVSLLGWVNITPCV